MKQIFGDFDEQIYHSKEYLVMGFSPSSVPLQQRWRNNGLSADFLADYLVTFFPVSDNDSSTFEKQEELRSAVSYIANELLENAMKFNDKSSGYSISIQFQLFSGHLMLSVSNSIPPQNIEKFQSFIQELLTSELQHLYVRQIECAEQDDNMTASGLGLLTMLDDYNVKVGWKFETVQQSPEVIAVTTMVRLLIS